MPFFSIAFLCGVVLLQQFAYLPSKLWLVAIIILFITNLFFKKIPWHYMGFLFGFAWTLGYAHLQLSWQLPKIIEGKPIVITGVIASIPNKSEHRWSFLFKLDTVANQPANGLVRLTWPVEQVFLKAGEGWQLPVKLKRIYGVSNPGGFDVEAYSFAENIRAEGSVIKDGPPQKTKNHVGINSIRQYFRDNIATNLPKSSTSHWITALAIGERKDIPARDWQVLRNTGTNHLMAIAGLHIGFMSAFVYGIVIYIWRRHPKWVLIFPAQHAASIAALLMAIIYSAMAGFSVPTERASIMFSCFLIIRLLRRHVLTWHIWSLALLCVLLLNPLNVLGVSFWLSFGAVAFIIYGMQGRLAPEGLWWQHGRIQWVTALGLIPLSLWLFQQCSLVSIIANSIAIPWVGFLIVPLTLIGTFLMVISEGTGSLLLKIADQLLQWLWVILTYLSELSWSSWYQVIPNHYVLITVLIGTVILLAPSGFPGRWLGICWCLPLLFWAPENPKEGEAWLTLLDVGQGLSQIVQTKNHILVFDAGSKWGDNFDMGESVVSPFLRTIGAETIDRLVISHGDNDHFGGANALLKNFKVKDIKTSVPEKFTFPNTSYCLRGESWVWDGVSFSFIYPDREHLGLGNNSSCVLSIKSHGKTILLTGDIEKSAEEFLLSNNHGELKSNVIVAPHHGSKTSGLPEFIQAVNPQIVLFSVGYLNRYHLPHPTVVETYAARHVIAYDTVNKGAIRLKLHELSEPYFYREGQRRYWYTY